MQKSKKFCFDDVDIPPPSPPLKAMKDSKKGHYNFNEFARMQQQENQFSPQKNDKYMMTLDTLDNKTYIEDEYQPAQGPLITKTTNLTVRAPKQTGTTIEKHEDVIVAESVTSYLHVEEINYIEILFLQILNNQSKIELANLIGEIKFSDNDRYAKEQTIMFLLLDNLLKDNFDFVVNNNYTKIVKSDVPFNQHKFNNIRKWAVYALRKIPQLSKLAEEKKISKQWLMLAQNRINELANKFLSQGDYNEAIIVSNVQDKAFLQSFECNQSKLMRKQYTHLQSGDIKIAPKFAWIVDFAISILYFDPEKIPICMVDICKKYNKSSISYKPAFFPSLVALTLHFSLAQNKLEIEKNIEKIVTQEKRLSYLDQIFYLYTFKQYQSRYPKLYRKVAQSLIIKIYDPALFVEMLIFSEFDQKQIEQSIKIYVEKNSNFSKNREQNIQKLYSAISSKANLPQIQKLTMTSTVQVQVLEKWMKCEKYLKLYDEKKYMESALYFSNNFYDIQTSTTHQHETLFNTLIKNLVKFQLACSYKQENRRQYYKLLQELKPQLRQHRDIAIVEGCISFIELKFKVCWLGDEQKLINLFELCLYLKSLCSDRQSAPNAQCFLKNIRKTLEKSLKTLDGKIFIGELATEIVVNTEKEAIAKSIKNQLRLRENMSKQDLSKNPFFVLLEMLNWNQDIANLIVIRLLFG